jgi:hypothetical protein
MNFSLFWGGIPDGESGVEEEVLMWLEESDGLQAISHFPLKIRE